MGAKKRFQILKNFVPKTLFGRSLLILITPVFLIQVVATLTFFDNHWNRMTGRLGYAVAGEIAMITELVKDAQTDRDFIINRAEEDLSFLVSFAPGDKLSDDTDTMTGWMVWESMVGRTLRKELESKIPYRFVVNVDFQEKWIEVRIQLEEGILNISLPQKRMFSSSGYVFLLWVFAASMILLIIAVLFMRNQIRPIRRLAIAAERFGKGRDVENFKVEGAKEVRQAGRAFLDMKIRIQRQITQRTEMLAGVSHDLRTPLTRLKLQLAMLGHGPDIDAMKGDIHDMEKMIEGYLNFVRGEGQELAIMTDFSELLYDVVAAAKREGADISIEMNNIDLHMPLRPTALKRCLANLLSNAAKYAQHIWVCVEKNQQDWIDIIIEDDGPGIPPDQYDAVFRPFYRVDSSRNLETGGVGLGLPIAMDIIHAHGGKIELDRSLYGGLKVYISLPI